MVAAKSPKRNSRGDSSPSPTTGLAEAPTPPSDLQRSSPRIRQLAQRAKDKSLPRRKVGSPESGSSSPKKEPNRSPVTTPNGKSSSQRKRRRNEPSKSPTTTPNGEIDFPNRRLRKEPSESPAITQNGVMDSPSKRLRKEANEPSPEHFAGKSDHAKIKETLRVFNKFFLHFVQEEEERCKKVEPLKGKASSSSKEKTKNGKKNPEMVNPKACKVSKSKVYTNQKHKAKRPDLKTMTKMMETKAVMFSDKRIGSIPGIDVGFQFYSRAEMVVVGCHSHWLNGIDYMGAAYRKGEYKKYTFPLAVAIVLSGMYEDDLDNAEDVVYTGQGGHNLNGDKRQSSDQKMERGNLALKNCVDQDTPVRVIRGLESSSSYTGKVYTYDGLYKVESYWAETGISGFRVFKFRLKRLEGQPLLTTNQVHFVYGRAPQSVAEIRGLVCKDISGGQEKIPVPATNLVDDPPIPPTGFTYCKSILVPKNIKLPPNRDGCSCIGSCTDSRTCPCAKLNGGLPYVHRDGGRLIEAKDVVYECGPKCGCGPACVNRTSQRELKYRLEVFRTPKKGWAVRSWDFIPSGAPICEYTGVLRRTEDVDTVLVNDYIFEIDCLQTMKGLGGREKRSCDVSVPTIHSPGKEKQEDRNESIPEFCIDAGNKGNVARFINHSCGPNLFVQCVLSANHDMKLARVMLFAADNIPPLQELTYDYGYALDSVHGPDGKVKQMACYCGAEDCRKRLF